MYLCDTCGAGFDKPHVITSSEVIDGHTRTDREELCPLCFQPYFVEADRCECGDLKPKTDHTCRKCRDILKRRFIAFADTLTEGEEDQLDDWLDGVSVKDRRNFK